MKSCDANDLKLTITIKGINFFLACKHKSYFIFYIGWI